ncbi:hypothetical protein KXV81_000862 [Aspergillus fumigatus]|nr:hypothetical protein KXX45_009536 [Aspergillus fumigatus]KAH1364117.1 hypothetical protein KXX63_005254 [Aspergillus fumigatus]KAH1377598.1 hypothetical protein KXX50_009063 [Aspergillus fumigatus]KAH1402479.1 hypothetical protein KXX51_002501 [Aspergillus fumigatus]KAH1444732.1 hypothetical protein KXX68_008009 [Aspergillus fumigatus]
MARTDIMQHLLMPNLEIDEDLKRVRENQRKCRQRKRDYIAELESKIAAYAEAAAEADRRRQAVEENLCRENEALRTLLASSGFGHNVPNLNTAQKQQEAILDDIQMNLSFTSNTLPTTLELHADSLALELPNVTSSFGSPTTIRQVADTGLVAPSSVDFTPSQSTDLSTCLDFPGPGLHELTVPEGESRTSPLELLPPTNQSTIGLNMPIGLVDPILQDTTLCAVAIQIVRHCNKKNLSMVELDAKLRHGYRNARSPLEGCTTIHDKEDDIALAFGYSAQDLHALPDKANLGLSCGNPVAHANIKEGETIVDLGSGGGIDVLLAARKVGPEGTAIGIDMTKDMINLAKKTAEAAGLSNTRFIEATITSIPLPDASVDCIISNCVINLVPSKDKPTVFQEIARLLKPGGRVAISDILARKELPAKIVNDMALYVGCIAGASQVAEYEEYLKRAGFKNILIVDTKSDLNLYKQSSYLGQSSCCGPAGSCKALPAEYAEMDFNEWVASYQIYAVKDSSLV